MEKFKNYIFYENTASLVNALKQMKVTKPYLIIKNTIAIALILLTSFYLFSMVSNLLGYTDLPVHKIFLYLILFCIFGYSVSRMMYFLLERNFRSIHSDIAETHSCDDTKYYEDRILSSISMGFKGKERSRSWRGLDQMFKPINDDKRKMIDQIALINEDFAKVYKTILERRSGNIYILDYILLGGDTIITKAESM